MTEITQPTGAVVEWVTYDVYGQPTIRDINGTVITQSAVGNPYLYTGREYDPESGLYFYRARSYDPGTGRFLQRDPAGYRGGLSLYEYARTGPSSLSDPLGLDPHGAPTATPVADLRAAEQRLAEAQRKKEKAQEALDVAYAAAQAAQQVVNDIISTIEDLERLRDRLRRSSVCDARLLVVEGWLAGLNSLLQEASKTLHDANVTWANAWEAWSAADQELMDAEWAVHQALHNFGVLASGADPEGSPERC